MTLKFKVIEDFLSKKAVKFESVHFPSLAFPFQGF